MQCAYALPGLQLPGLQPCASWHGSCKLMGERRCADSACIGVAPDGTRAAAPSALSLPTDPICSMQHVIPHLAITADTHGGESLKQPSFQALPPAYTPGR